MHYLNKLIIVLLALEHFYILYLEGWQWTSARALSISGLSSDVAAKTTKLGRNQGIYNAFLGAGFVWALLAGGEFGLDIARFFAICAIIAGLYGGAVFNRKIWLVQLLPAVLALVSTFFLN